MDTIACDLCGAREAAALPDGPAAAGLIPGGMALVRCPQCGLIYLNPRPAPHEMEAFYPADYAPFRPAIEDERLPAMRWMRRRKLVRRRELLERYGGRKTGRILDVGCATGLFLHEMALAGWETRGVELSGTAAEYARQRFGLDVFRGTLSDMPLEPGAYDAITYWDVLEHTFSPAEELARSACLLKPGGLLAINVPNWDSWERKLFGPYWIGYDPPRHLYVFTRATLTALLRRAGFRPLAWTCFMPSYFSFIISLERWLNGRRPAAAGLVRLLRMPGARLPFEPFFATANRLRRGGVIALFAQRMLD